MNSFFADSDRWRTFAFAYVMLFVVGLFVYSLYFAKDTWDMLGYAGSAASIETSDKEAVHAKVYEAFKAHASAEEYQELTAATEYRVVMANDAEAFWEQIPYYKIRVLYVLLLLLISKVGVSIFTAMHFFTAAFTAAGLLMIYSSARRYVHSFFWIVFPIIFFQFGEDFSVYTYGGVDTFAFFWVSLICALFLKKSAWLLPVLALSVFIRTDLLVFVPLVCAAVLWLQPDLTTIKKLAACCFVALLIYLGINHWAENYGWSTVFYYAHVSNMSATHPSEFSKIGLTWDQIITAYLTPEWITKWFWFAVACAVASWLLLLFVRPLREENGDATLRLVLLGAIGVVYVIVHYLLFPGLYMRFFIGQCSFMVLALFGLLTYMLREKYNAPTL